MSAILLAYVPSATSEAAFTYAVDEAKRRDASLLVLASERAPDPRKSRGVSDQRPLEERLAETGLGLTSCAPCRSATTPQTTSSMPSRTTTSSWW